MGPDEILAVTGTERLATADLLEGLDPGEWRSDSLCEGWTVRDVAAHLTLTTRISPVWAVVGLIRARGSLDRFIRDSARDKASRLSSAELVAEIREHADSPRRPPGTSVADPYVDVLVHAQDVARPLGRAHPMPTEHLGPALDHAARGRHRFAGLRLVATDLDWSTGGGPGVGEEVVAPASALLLVLAGRRAGLDDVPAPGRALLAERLT